MKKIIIPLLILLHLLILSRLVFTAWPEMFSYPYLLNKGFLIYKDFAHPYEPLMTFILSWVYKVFNTTLFTHQIFVWVWIIFIDLILIFASLKLLGNRIAGLIPVLLFILLQPVMDGNMLWFDLGATPFILLGLLCFMFFKSTAKKLFWIGFFYALAVFVKQQAVLLVIPLGVYFLLSKKFRPQFFSFLAGGLIVTLAVNVYLFLIGVYPDYLFWTKSFPLLWLPKFPGYAQTPDLKQVLVMAGLFLPPFFWAVKNFKFLKDTHKVLIMGLAASVAMAFPRFSYLHLQPALAILMLLVISLMGLKKINVLYLTLPLVVVALYLWKSQLPALFNNFAQARFYGPEEFRLAEFIKSSTQENDRVYFLGVHSLVYVLSGRLPPKPWVDNFVWYMEIPGVQEKVVQGFENDPPAQVLWNLPSPGKWYELSVYQPAKITAYVRSQYKKTGNINPGLEIWDKKD